MVSADVTTCAICGKELGSLAAESPLFPFCSRQCKQADLYRWFQGSYRIVDSLTPERLATELYDGDEADA